MTNTLKQDLTRAKKIIDTVNLSEVVKRLVLVDGWKERHAHEACNQYRNFLFLKLKYGEQFELPPSYDIDEAWHAHILHTEDYVTFCEEAFGCYLHHHPHHRNGTLSDKQIGEMFEAQTQKLYQQEFGTPLYAVRPVSLIKQIAGIFHRIWLCFIGNNADNKVIN